MSDHAPTLNSRLRVLVAKTFRAEQLYGTIRNTSNAKQAALAGMVELANDIRAREWQRTHAELRSHLNEILNLGKSSLVVDAVLKLLEEFRRSTEKDLTLLEKGVEEVREAATRQEFATVWRYTAELIRIKARYQANKAIAEELLGVLESSGFRGLSTRPVVRESVVVEELEEKVASLSNVVPLRRNIGS